ncbi:MAG: hypothetical protein LBG48_04250 [Rickettsiales bacterium]|jgi:hypothetical protein|nr:hypothetical protein [Rickettsiales bacterium]
MKVGILLVACLLLTNCSTTQYLEIQKKLNLSISQKNYNTAIKIVDDKNFYPEKRSVLVKKLEQGAVNYMAGNYHQALHHFNEAEKISEELFTISIKSKLKDKLDDNLDDYLGERYELSMIRFYKSLINYRLYKIGKYAYTQKILTTEEKLEHLRNARSNILKWESLANSYKEETAGEPVYKSDILAKIWGGFVFEENEDQQRANSSYKTARDILFRNYNIYPSFNKSHDKFKKNFKKLPSMEISQVSDKYIVKTDYANNLDTFLTQKVNNNGADNLLILYKEGNITTKKTKITKIPISILAFTDRSGDFFHFLSKVSILWDNNMLYVKIELPVIEQKNINNNIIAKIFNIKGKEIKSFPLALVEPLSEIAYNDFEESKNSLYAKLISVTTAKYISAITTSYLVYKSGIDNNNPLVSMGAVISFMGMVKAIDNSNKPDLRQWTTLPDNIRIGTAALANGDYTVKLYSVGDNEEKLTHSENIKIDNARVLVDINY